MHEIKLDKPVKKASFGPFEVDLRSGEVRKHGFKVRLQEKPFQILATLLNQPGELIPREGLHQALWPDNHFVEFDHNLNNAINKLREALGDSPEKPRYLETLPRRGYRFIATVSWNGEERTEAAAVLSPTADQGETSGRATVAEAQAGAKHDRKPIRWAVVTGAALLVVVLAMGGWLSFSRKAHALTDKDTIVLADFTNTTGDTVFDDTLRQGLSVQLEQSPFLSLVSEQKIQQTLQMMDQKPDAKLTPGIARELCQRTGSAAVLDGSIAQIGTHYLLTLKAANCVSGISLASTQAQASDKNHVLDALGRTASEIRNKLGESLSTVQRFDTPLEQATTPSLEALQAYSLGVRTIVREADEAGAVPLFRRAINLDPNFAMAYAMLYGSYSARGEADSAFDSIRRAFDLRDRVSEGERFFIESLYHSVATGDLLKEKETVEFWAMMYPRDSIPRNRLGMIYETLGQYDKSLLDMHEALRLLPESGLEYCNVVSGYISLNRLEEARATAEEANARNLDSLCLHKSLYVLAFLLNDSAGMKQQMAYGAGEPGVEDNFLGYEADTAAYSGRLANAREFSLRAIASAESAKRKQMAAVHEASAALREALFGNVAESRQHVASALRLSKDLSTCGNCSFDVQYVAALALALAGDTGRAQSLADDLGKPFPEDTLIQFNYLPTLHAQLALNRNDAVKALEVLQAAAPYELGDVGPGSLYPVYIRGNSYLAAHQGKEAAADFQKILDHRGIVLNEPIGALAHLGLARAYMLQGDTAKVRMAYQDFFALWKDADPDISILKKAKAEYAKLQ